METTKFKRILIPTDFSPTSELAIDKACKIAQKFDSEIFILHVMEADPYKTVFPENSKEDVILQKYVMDRMEKIAEDINQKYGIEVATLVGEHKPIQVIEDSAKENRIDLIVMGTHGAGGLREYFLGSNAQKVVHSTVCPVLTIKKDVKNTDLTNIIMPVKNWENTLEKIPYVIELASAFNSKVHVLGIVNGKKKEDEESILTLVASAEKQLQDAGINHVTKIVKSSQSAKETLEYSKQADANLIVVMTDNESHLTEKIHHLISRQILNHSDIPVMSIKPAMYHSEHVSFHSEPVHRSEHVNPN